MSNEISTEVSPEIINSLILTGDMSKLTAQQQTQYYTAVCKSVGVNPITQPFAIIVLQGKKTLYATKGCTQQLSDTRKINTEIKKTETLDGVYVSYCRATMPDGRYTDDIGAVSTVGIKGAELANAMMKSITKAKRRAVLALCGLGMPDESEVEDIHPAAEHKQDTTKSRIENIIDAQSSEVKEDAPKEVTKPKKAKKETEAVPTESPKQPDNDAKKSDTVNIKTVIGQLEGVPEIKSVDNPKTGVKSPKYRFFIQGVPYGTFDLVLAKQVTDALDLNKEVLLKFGYTERKLESGKILNDLVSFEYGTMEDLPIDEVK